ncbi:AMP-binding protein [Conexibacter stalactiti]|uniref:AMP-binding protein n=1 Tax=Conexibacter stalactiti TaxID=1940611 RepID=A0ABU4HQN5_9ACTN|nr:AMP-binding protein [Conexibacter stalactiti]MDW5594860.1 AMP-binding protein [Conexibacter stalactiti]MEC5035502.1 AMP-binding protein [Conexibacter stalactiti]
MSEQRMGFWAWAQAEPNRPAVVDARGRTRTYGELDAEVNRLTHGLREVAGLGVGDTVACVMTNGIPMLSLYLAAMQSGLYLVPVNYHLTAAEIRYIVEDSGASAVLCSGRVADVVREAVDDRAIVFCDGGAVGLRDLTELTGGQPAARPQSTAAGSLMQYTSGTTGRPKGVKRPLSGQDADAGAHVYEWLFDALGIGQDFARWCVASPMYHTANITPASGALHLGGSVVLMEGWTPELFLETVQRERVTGTHMVPTQFHRLLALDADTRAGYDTSSLRYVLHGAAPCPPADKRAMIDWFGPIVYEYYGSTEVGSTVATPQQWLERPGTVGLPMSISELRILDERGEEVPAGTEGIVYMRQGEDRMEYHNDPAKTDGVRSGRLLTVGDRGYVDDDGFLFLTGRVSDMIIVGGVNTYPAEIEATLLEHRWVLDAGVAGVPDGDLGEVPEAWIQPALGAPDAERLRAELAAFCEQRLARHKRPRQIHLRESLPRDPNGKLYKQRLTAERSPVHT